MELHKPRTPEELAELLAAAASAGRRISLGGGFTKNRMAHPAAEPEIVISTAGMSRVLEYEPRDLTISVEAGLRFGELSRILAEQGQMAPLDPPFHDSATVGGVVAANTSGPRRRLYGTVRDFVIGMKFATLEGKLVQSGGMVVKNVAGLDMAKLMIGSFGTLAAIGVVNLKVVPAPAHSLSFVSSFAAAEDLFHARDTLLRGVLQPAAADVMNPAAALRLGRQGYLLLVQAGGSRAVLDRYSRELAAEALDGEEERALWREVREYTPRFLEEHPDGAVVRVSSTISDMRGVMEEIPGPVVARGGSGVSYGYFPSCQEAGEWLRRAAAAGRKAVLEYVPAGGCPGYEQWPAPGSDFAMMEKIKRMFDPRQLLNQGRLYGRL